MHRVERLSIREISRRTGLHRKTVRRALSAAVPPKIRPPVPSKLDPFKGWICEQLAGCFITDQTETSPREVLHGENA